MAALPPVAKVVRLDFLLSMSPNSRIFFRRFLQYSGALSLNDAQTVVNTAYAAWAPNYGPRVTAAVALLGVTLTDLSSTSSPQMNATGAAVGSNAGQMLTTGTAVVVSDEILRRFRGGHGRYYHPGPVAGDMVNFDTLSAGGRTSWQTAATAFQAALVAGPPAGVGTLTSVQVSYFQGFTNKTFPSGRIRPVPTQRVTPLVDVIVQEDVNFRIGSQRRRLQQSL